MEKECKFTPLADGYFCETCKKKLTNEEYAQHLKELAAKIEKPTTKKKGGKKK